MTRLRIKTHGGDVVILDFEEIERLSYEFDVQVEQPPPREVTAFGDGFRRFLPSHGPSRVDVHVTFIGDISVERDARAVEDRRGQIEDGRKE